MKRQTSWIACSRLSRCMHRLLPVCSTPRPAACRPTTTAPSWSCPGWLRASRPSSASPRELTCAPPCPRTRPASRAGRLRRRATDRGTLLALARGGTVNVLDVMLVRQGAGGQAVLPVRQSLDDHPRVRHARAVRRGVAVRGDERGLVTLATGLAGRRELSGQALRLGMEGARWSAMHSPARPVRCWRPCRRTTHDRCARSPPSASRRSAARCCSRSLRQT